MINLTFLVAWVLATLFLSASAEKLSSGEQVADYVTRKIAEADVMVFAKSYCPYCKASRKLVHELHDEGGHTWTLDVVDLDQMEAEDGPFIQMELLVCVILRLLRAVVSESHTF